MRRYSFFVIALLAWLIPFFLNLKVIVEGAIPFWYDPARDLLLGLANLQSPTFLGHPSGGIPGLFYGPYYVWFISIALSITKDPRWVTFITLTLPYFILFPLILSRFTKTLGKWNVLMLWIIFILTTSYSAQLWNANIAPLVYLVSLYLVFRINFASAEKLKERLMVLFAGIATGLIINFSMSFGVGILFSYLAFFLGELVFNSKSKWNKIWRLFLQRLSYYLIFVIGVATTYIPFAFFELRHGFNQTKAILYTLRRTILENSAVTGGRGLSDFEIIGATFNSFANLFKVPFNVSILILILAASYIFFQKRKKILRITSSSKRLLTILILNLIFVVVLYLRSVNPVWGYFFNGVEIIWLILIGVLAKEYLLLKRGLIILTLWVVLASGFGVIRDWGQPITTSAYAIKREAVDQVYEDAQNEPFVFFAYDSAIYTFDYDYLFQWLGQSRYDYLPGIEIKGSEPVYLVLPPYSAESGLSFINYKTPHTQYRTAKKWKLSDGTQILKRVRYK